MSAAVRSDAASLASWHAYAAALTDHMRKPTIASEARCITRYAEFAREMAPEHADTLVTIYCRFIAEAEVR